MFDFSFCIPTHHRETLHDCLESVVAAILNADQCKAEIIISGETQINKSLYLEDIKWVTPENTSASNNRNYAAQRSSGKYLIFIDDDVTINADYLLNLTRYLQKDKLHCLAGSTLRLKNKNPIDKAWLEAGFDRYLDLSSRFQFLRWAPTANLIVKRDVFFSICGFKNLPIPVGGEDVDFGCRIMEKGFGPIVSIPECAAKHLPITHQNLDKIIEKAGYYGMSEQWIAQEYSQSIIGKKAPFMELPSLSDEANAIRKGFYDGACSYSNDVFDVSLSQLASDIAN